MKDHATPPTANAGYRVTGMCQIRRRHAGHTDGLQLARGSSLQTIGCFGPKRSPISGFPVTPRIEGFGAFTAR